jgi:hypothetical protein
MENATAQRDHEELVGAGANSWLPWAMVAVIAVAAGLLLRTLSILPGRVDEG